MENMVKNCPKSMEVMVKILSQINEKYGPESMEYHNFLK